MWTLVLTVSLLCSCSEAVVTCRDHNNGPVDWYILYKGPSQRALTGLEYLYIASTDTSSVTKIDKSINDPNGVLANTLRPLFLPIRSMPQNFGFISYSDQPPGCSANDNFGHSKGVLMVDRTSSGVWLLHSTPQFPFRRDPDHFWPNTGTTFAQMFICITFPYEQFRHIGNHLQYIGAFPFEHDIPGDFHPELRAAVNWVKLAPPNNYQLLRSSGDDSFYTIAKGQAEQARDGDLYVKIAQDVVGSDVKAQTWGRQANRAPPYCAKDRFKVLNVNSVSTDLGTWNPTCDHSKWCVAVNSDWTCVADVNRAPTQYMRRGGAVCINSKDIKKTFQRFTGDIEDCTGLNIMDLSKANCESDPDHDMTPS